MSIRENVLDLNAMLLADKAEEAREKYYADDAVRKVAGQTPCVGRDAMGERDKDFVSSVTAFRKVEVKAAAVDEENGVSMVEWFMDYTHKDWGHVRQMHVCVQRWRDGRIYEEIILATWLGSEWSPMTLLEGTSGAS